jgi:hypothetical protein
MLRSISRAGGREATADGVSGLLFYRPFGWAGLARGRGRIGEIGVALSSSFR